MKKEIYINVSILDYGNGTVDCSLVQQVDDGELESIDISRERACKLMWELKLAGGRRTVRVNQFDRHIVSCDTYIFLPN